jgi:L-amino acid N-acyltransferase YncA
VAGDEAALRTMVEPREAYATGFSYRAVDDKGKLERIHRGAGGIYVLERAPPPGGFAMAVMLSASGTAFPVLAEEFDPGGSAAVHALEGLRCSRTARRFQPAACLGATAHVEAIEAAMSWRPDLEVDYDAMSLSPADWKPRRHVAVSNGVVEYRRATLADLDGLCPIAAEYERIEVITKLHVFDPKSCRATQAKSLARQVVYLATVSGRIVARAQTNARGWSHDQVGGVFVEPERRGMGIGRGVMDALMADIASRGRSASLFVKKSNAVARALYLSMGFTAARDYRISYFA